MRVTIVDVEWFSRTKFVPNELCMKISSYHKQLGDIVNFPTDLFTLRLDHDIMYMVREDLATPLPDVNMFDDRLRLYGNGFKFYNKYVPQVDDVILACRPDYLLYPLREENVQINSNFVRFFGNDDKLLPKIQDYHNTRRTKREIVVSDENFWQHSAAEVEACYKKLRFDYSIVFKNDINFDDIMYDAKKSKMFWDLRVRWSHNKCFIDLSTEEKANYFFKYMARYKKKLHDQVHFYCYIKYGGSHFKNDRQPFKDFSYYMRLNDRCKQQELWVIFLAPPRMTSPFWFHFEDIEAWTQNQHRLSFIDFMCRYRGRIKIYDLKDYLSNSTFWTDDATQRLMSLWRNYPELMERIGYRTYGSESDSIRMSEYVRGKRIRQIGET